MSHMEKRLDPKPVQGVVSVSNLPATQPVSGTVEANQGTAAAQTSAASWPVRLVGGTGDRAASIDSSTNSLQIVEYEHHEIHAGSAFSYYNVIDVTGAGTNRDYHIITPDTTKWCHVRLEFTTEAEFNVTIHEGITTSANGAVAAAFNRNRNSANAPGLQIFTAPTVTGTGTVISTNRTGSGTGDGGGFDDLEEWVLKQNTKYLFRFSKVATGTHYITIRLFWYEHTNKTA